MREIYKRCTLNFLRYKSAHTCRVGGIYSDINPKQDVVEFYYRGYSKSLLVQFSKIFHINSDIHENVIY